MHPVLKPDPFLSLLVEIPQHRGPWLGKIKLYIVALSSHRPIALQSTDIDSRSTYDPQGQIHVTQTWRSLDMGLQQIYSKGSLFKTLSSYLRVWGVCLVM